MKQVNIDIISSIISQGQVIEAINLSEAQHERRFVEMADLINSNRHQAKIVLIGGPSGSGKTSTSKRLAIQCRIMGLTPKVLELDNYFVEREETPRDENGEYDFECLEAMDLDLLGRQINELLSGNEVEIPHFDFVTGHKSYQGHFMRLEENDLLILEGIHALNPAMLPSVDRSKVFVIYASAMSYYADLDSVLDDAAGLGTNKCSCDEQLTPADNRLLRRLIRDSRTRGRKPEDTIAMWQSVRRGEEKYILPFRNNADAAYNTSQIYELPVLKYYAEPLLRGISPDSPAYPVAARLLKFLDCIIAPTPEEIAAIPPTSILREFIDGQTL